MAIFLRFRFDYFLSILLENVKLIKKLIKRKANMKKCLNNFLEFCVHLLGTMKKVAIVYSYGLEGELIYKIGNSQI